MVGSDRARAALAVLAGLGVLQVGAITLNVNDTSECYRLFRCGSKLMFVSGGANVGLLPQPYYWWEAGYDA